MDKRKHKRISTLNRMIIVAISSVVIVFTLMIAFITNSLFLKSIESAKALDAENAGHVTDSITASFNNMTQWLHITQETLGGLDFHSETFDESADSILKTLLENNTSIHSAWLFLEKGTQYEDKFYKKGYVVVDGASAKLNPSSLDDPLNDPKSSPWYYVPLTEGKVYASAAKLNDYGLGDGPVYVVSISAPLVSNGETIGVCGVDVLHRDVVSLNHHLRAQGDDVVMLLSQDMTVLHSDRPELVGENLADLGYDNISAFRSAMSQGELFCEEIMSPILNEKVFLCLQPILLNSGSESEILYLYVGSPLGTLYDEAYYVVSVIVFASAVCLLFIIVIIFFSAVKVVSPIRALARQALQVAAGDFSADIFQSSKDDQYANSEISTLRRAFSEMLHALHENLRTVEKRVDERTHELRKLNNYIKILVDSTSNISLLMDKDFNILYCSDSYAKMMNKEMADIIGKPLHYALQDFSDKSYIERSGQRMKRILAEEESFVEDDAVTWSDGTQRMYRIIYGKIKDENDLFEGTVVIMRDLTDVWAEEAEHRLSDMLGSTLLPCQVWNEKGEVVAYNREIARTFGISEDLSPEDFNTNFLALQPKYQPDGSLTEDLRVNGIKSAFENGFVQTTVQLEKCDGTPVHFMVTIACISWLTGHRLIVYYYDITKSIMKEKEAKEAEDRIKLMLNGNPMICIMRDDQGNIIDCNQEALNVFGVSDKAEFHRDFYSYFPEYQPDGTKSKDMSDEIMRVVDDKGYYRLERTFMTSKGELVPVDSKVLRIPWKDKFYYLSYSFDLRENKANEEKLREIAEKERESRLQKEAAQAANEAKSQFLANMSHEIRTPMNAVLGMSELLLQENLNKRQLRYANDIKMSAISLLEIINDILDVSKIQAGKLSLVPVHYDFNMLVDNIGSMAQFLVEDKNLTFKLVMQEDAPIYLYGDDVRLRQVLLNLLSNAIKFTEKGYVQLAVVFTDNVLEFTVSDTGIGIATENIPTLFNAFEQADILKNRNTKGTGLGLSITKAIVDMMGGSITLESEYGQGTSFIVKIPYELGDPALIVRIDTRDIIIYAPEAVVLVVDDNRTNLNVACGLLELCKIQADAATSGKQAIEMILQKKYDIVFMDHRMPEMSGIDTTKIIRSMGLDVPIVALTASAVVGAKETMLEAGMDDYLWKPIMKEELMHILKKWIPSEKLLTPPSGMGAFDEADDDEHKVFWGKIGQIEGLSVSAGLDRICGLRDVYEKSLKLMTQEIDKSVKNLDEFLATDDIENFRIEVHGIKGALANIGAVDLSKKAYAFENASDKMDIEYCIANLPAFLDGLRHLNSKLKDAFSAMNRDSGKKEIPMQMLQVFGNLLNAIDDVDFVLIEQELQNLNAMSVSGTLKDEIEQLKDMVMMMDYEGAAAHIERLVAL
ncbi:MAG: ATP-binding protein [Clostridiales bacterium]|nr:ATP-binding protein [Clostridiales bacterium]